MRSTRYLNSVFCTHALNRNERGEVTTDTTEIQRIVRNYYEQLHAKKLDKLGEMDNFLETYNLPKLNQEAESLNRLATTSKIEAVIKKLLAYQSPRLDAFRGKFYQTFKELTPIFLKLSQNPQEEGRLQNSFYETTIILIPKSGNDTTKKENYRPVSLMNIDAKICNKMLAIQIQ